MVSTQDLSFAELIQQGDRLVEEQKFDEAIECYSQASAIDPESAAPIYKIGTIFLEQDNFEKAQQYFEYAVALKPKVYWGHYGLGLVFMRQEAWQEAKQAFQEALKLEPGFRLAQDGLDGISKAKSDGQIVEGDDCSALISDSLESDSLDKAASRAENLDPDDLQLMVAHIQEGDRLFANKQLEDAVAEYKQAIEVVPSAAEAYSKLGEVLLEQTQFDRAFEYFAKSAELNPTFLWAHYGLARTLAEQKYYEQAIAAYQRTIKIDPNFLYGHYKFGKLLIGLGNWEEAKVELKRAYELDPSFYWSLCDLGQVLLRQENWEGAMDVYEQALLLVSYNSDVRRLIKDKQHECFQLASQQVVQAANWFDGEIGYIAGNYVVGWITNRNLPTEFCQVDLVVDGEMVGSTQANLSRQEIPGLSEGRKGRCWFKLQIPDSFLTGQEHTLEVLGPNHKPLDALIQFRYSLTGHLDIVRKHYVAGWVLDSQSDRPVEIDLHLDGQKYISLLADLKREDVTDRCRCGFELSIPISLHSSQHVLITLKDSKIPILNTPQALLFLVGAINTLYKLSNAVREGLVDLSPLEKNWLLTQFLPQSITGYRDAMRGSGASTLTCCPEQVIKGEIRDVRSSDVVDVIIPIYRNFKITKLCVESVLKAKNETAFNLVAINDESPEPEIWPYLEALAEQGKIQLLVNHSNKGFVHSVNRGMGLNADRDVVLLNSDAIVVDYWLDRLRTAAYSCPNIASATPISNHASIFSYPRMAEEVEQMPEDIPAQELDEICALVNAGALVDVPTNHGFCCFLRRAALTQAGLFDEQKWEKGYGEEVDWSQRSRRLGWRHVAVPGVFIHHVGSQSFSKNKEQAISKALAKLASEYPEFDAIVHDFVKVDPLAKYRRRIDVERLKRAASGYMLYIAHGMGGGTRRHLNDMSQLLKQENCHVLYLTPDQEQWVQLTSPIGLDIYARYNLVDPLEFQVLVEDLKAIQVFHVHIHSTIGFVKEDLVWRVPEQLQIAYDVTVHDYQTICPRVNLVTAKGKYCGEPTAEACDVCILKNGTFVDAGIQSLYQEVKTLAGWRSYFETRLRKARKIFVPSQDVQSRLLKYFPDIHPEVRYHPESYPPSHIPGQQVQSADYCPTDYGRTDYCYRVAVLGAISDIKGYDILYDCASYALDFACPVEFVIFGFTKDDVGLGELGNITFTGAFQHFEELQANLQKYPCDVAAFFSTWPETYSYTLSEALMLGLTPVAFNIGAFSERLQPISGAALLELNASPETIVRELIQVAKSVRSQQEPLRGAVDHRYHSLLKDYYELEG